MDNHRILRAGDLVQWYRIEEVLGRGGFGVTYLATDTNLDHRVAIKEYMPGWAVERLADNSLAPLNDDVRRDFELGVANFLREARTLVKFRHPNIVRVMTVFEANNTAYLVMEYEEGEEFKAYVQRGDGIDEKSLQSLILHIADGLEQVHQTGYLHRDIKPVNLIIRKDGTPVLLDFGAARPTDGEAAAHTAYVSAGYTPIEQYQEGEGMEVGPWTDIYALGATLYYAISGETPIGPTGRLAAMVNKSPDPLKPARLVGKGRYSAPFLEAIDWALSFRPTGRPRDLSQWREAFEDSEDLRNEPEVPEYRTAPEPKNLRGDGISSQSFRSRKRAGKKSSGTRVVALFASLLTIAVAAGWFYNNFRKDMAVDNLLRQADAKFDDGTHVDGALPLYREVLAAEPANRQAISRIEEIEQLTKNRIETAVGSNDFEQASQSLADLKKISSNSNDIERYQQDIINARQHRDAELVFSQAIELNEAGKSEEVLAMLDQLQAAKPDDPRIGEIEASANAAINRATLQRQQREQQLADQRRREAESERRVAETNRRQRQRKLTYNTYLREAEDAVSQGDIASARRWLDDARALQISDGRLSQLESQVVEQEAYQRKPLSEYEISYASGQFNALRSAVESKNQPSIVSLSEGSPSREGLFDTLFSRYTRLNARIIDVKSDLDPKRVTARLRIEAMIMPNGDIVYPSPAYRDTELTIKRERYGWSRIIW